MLNQEIKLSELITQNFDQESLDIVSEACEFLEDFVIYNADNETARWCLWFFNNYKVLHKVSFFVDESHENFDIEYDFAFDGIDPLNMLDSKFYCRDEQKSYEVTGVIKMLCEIGQGIQWAMDIVDQTNMERERSLTRSMNSLMDENKSLRDALWGNAAK